MDLIVEIAVFLIVTFGWLVLPFGLSEWEKYKSIKEAKRNGTWL